MQEGNGQKLCSRKLISFFSASLPLEDKTDKKSFQEQLVWAFPAWPWQWQRLKRGLWAPERKISVFYKLAVDFLFANNLSSAERFLLGGFLTIWTHRQTGRWWQLWLWWNLKVDCWERKKLNKIYIWNIQHFNSHFQPKLFWQVQCVSKDKGPS